MLQGARHKPGYLITALCIAVSAAILLSSLLAVPVQGEGEHGACGTENLGCISEKVSVLSMTLRNMETPTMSNVTQRADGQGRAVTYRVETRGAVTADMAEFKAQANETLNDKRGWAGMNIVFQETNGDSDFTLFLSEASQMTSFSANGCDSTYSCAVGRNVIINQDRWLSATPSWNNAGGSLRDYRHMVVNHEVGHWLGHGHLPCGGSGQLAPVMQQQSIDLQGCSFNPWPLERELWSTRLGI